MFAIELADNVFPFNAWKLGLNGTSWHHRRDLSPFQNEGLTKTAKLMYTNSIFRSRWEK